MASVFGKDFSLDYYMDGHVYFFEAAGETLYDEKKGIITDGWEQKLCEFVERVGWNRITNHGRMAFVLRLIREGKVKGDHLL